MVVGEKVGTVVVGMRLGVIEGTFDGNTLGVTVTIDGAGVFGFADGTAVGVIVGNAE